MMVKSGREEGIPYSFSRWTDVPAAKWAWFTQAIAEGKMIAFDPRDAIPYEWSLKPEDTLGLVFWTKDPKTLARSHAMLKPYRLKVHVTITGWEEVEPGVPDVYEAASAAHALAKQIGPENVTWRFSPVPLVPDAIARFRRIADLLQSAGWGGRTTDRVYLSFLQPNDRIPETRDREQKLLLMVEMAAIAKEHRLQVMLCNEDRTLFRVSGLPENLSAGICAPPEDFALPGHNRPPSEGCGCVLMADPFTVNETCTMGCRYCLSPETPVLYSDLVWRPIGQVQVGDRLIGFDEFPTRVGAQRKLRETIVEGVQISRRKTLRLITGETDVLTTGNHGWIRHHRGNWRATSQLRRGHDLRQMGCVPDLPFTEKYRVGYLSGMSLGDGTFRYQPGQRSDKLGFPQPYWRVALKDEEALGRIVAYLATFGVESHIRPFSEATETRAAMQKVEIRSLGRLAKIHELVLTEHDSPEFRRGFLAGFFDAEGSHNQNLRMHQKDQRVLERVAAYGASLGFLFDQETYDPCPSVRLVGPARERLRFLSTIRPAISRKRVGFVGVEADSTPDLVRAIEPGPVADVIDIQTSTRTFFAAGLATHNCYAADLTLAPKKRNTTRGLPVVQ